VGGGLGGGRREGDLPHPLHVRALLTATSRLVPPSTDRISPPNLKQKPTEHILEILVAERQAVNWVVPLETGKTNKSSHETMKLYLTTLLNIAYVYRYWRRREPPGRLSCGDVHSVFINYGHFVMFILVLPNVCNGKLKGLEIHV